MGASGLLYKGADGWRRLGHSAQRPPPLSPRPYCITDGAKFRLKDIDPGDTAGLTSEAKPRAKEALQMGVEALAGLQDMLYAQD